MLSFSTFNTLRFQYITLFLEGCVITRAKRIIMGITSLLFTLLIKVDYAFISL